MPKVTKTVAIHNPKGLHLRPAGAIAQLAGQFQADVTLTKDGLTVDAASVLDLLTLVATCGSEVFISAEGLDAQQTVDAIAHFIETDTSDDENEE